MREWDEIDLAPIMLIKSAEPVYGDRAVDTLKARLRERDMNTDIVTLDASSYEAGALTLYASPSLFAEPRAVVIPNLERLCMALEKDLLEYITQPEQDVVLIMRHNGGMRGKKVLSAVTKAGVPTITITQIKRVADKAAAVQQDVRDAGRRITTSAVGALVDALGSDLRELLSGTQQLLADVRGTIDDSDVRTYFAGRIEATGFNVADAAIAGHSGRAVELARHAMSTGVAPVVIIAAMATGLRRLTHLLGHRSAGASSSLMGQRLNEKLPQWQLDRAKRELRGWSASGLAAAVQALAHADEQVKGGSRDPAYAVEKAILIVAKARQG